MRTLVTGASGFVGSAVVPEPLRAGHQVVGLARLDASTTAVAAAGAQVQRGDPADLDGLRRGASSVGGVIHLGFIHDFANFANSAETDRAAIQAMAAALAGSNRPLVVTSGTLGAGAPGTIWTEDDPGDASRRFSESALGEAPHGVRGAVVRLSPTVHGDGDHGFVPRLAQIARVKGISDRPVLLDRQAGGERKDARAGRLETDADRPHSRPRTDRCCDDASRLDPVPRPELRVTAQPDHPIGTRIVIQRALIKLPLAPGFELDCSTSSCHDIETHPRRRGWLSQSP
jgi:hypothetical protein